MGFPVGYSELFLPKLLLHIVFFLGSLRKLVFWAFNSIGLADLLDTDTPWPAADQSLTHTPTSLNPHPHPHPEFYSVSAMLIQELLPVIRFDELCSSSTYAGADSCAVCLYEFDGEAEIRRLTNCRHIFHRSCLDRWMQHDQRTCPLCRTPLIPDELQDSFNERFWAAAAIIPDSSFFSSEAELFFSSVCFYWKKKAFSYNF
ncbi:Anaphase-promoting complex (APC) subunit 11 protein [Dioscorea alata]|uniref:Anaphase-promoting complex (APC) subunit 11 protein n=1 Tax=Dioscorea alata TaxID=55571 RepID=A0ACB7UUK9_DIOAL|nr:Anaphase-promoting complex (APC) subunit 11 protein [Dioscorea alata]